MFASGFDVLKGTNRAGAPQARAIEPLYPLSLRWNATGMPDSSSFAHTVSYLMSPSDLEVPCPAGTGAGRM